MFIGFATYIGLNAPIQFQRLKSFHCLPFKWNEENKHACRLTAHIPLQANNFLLQNVVRLVGFVVTILQLRFPYFFIWNINLELNMSTLFQFNHSVRINIPTKWTGASLGLREKCDKSHKIAWLAFQHLIILDVSLLLINGTPFDLYANTSINSFQSSHFQ